MTTTNARGLDLALRSDKVLLLKAGMEIVQTVDNDWMVLQNGFQVGGNVDRSGAGDMTFSTWREAYAYACSRAETWQACR